MSSGCHIGTSPGWSNTIFRGRPGDTGRGHPWNVPGTNTCRLGTLLIPDEDMNDTIKIISSLEDSGILIHGNTETVKYKTKKTRCI